MPLFGTLSIWTALLALIASLGLYLFGGTRLTKWARGAFVLATVGVLSTAGTLGALLVTHRFDVAYVYEHSARAMAPLYWFPSFWAGQEGSFLLWAFWTSLLGVVLACTSGGAERRVMPIYGSVLLFLLAMLAIKSPFVLLDTQGMPTPTEGLGLNPNLENYWMVIHPPTLFLGFSSLAAPFAFALAALFWRTDLAGAGWLRRALPWGLFGFAVLGLAMMMGGYWAYEMLGWGGFWAWDPVENGPFVPWIALIGFLHAAQIQRVRGGFDKPTLFFATLPFIGAMYESYMTRSGVLTDFSVHSFSKLGGISNTILLGVLLAAVIISVGMLLWRGRALKGGEGTLEVPATREFGYTIAIVLLTLAAIIAAVGMSAPLLTGFAVKMHWTAHIATVKEDFYNKAMFPLAVLLSVGMGLGPHLAWRGKGKPDGSRLVVAYALSVVAALGYVVAARHLGTPLTGAKMVPQLLLFTTAVFAVISNLMLLRRMTPNPPVSGGTQQSGEVGSDRALGSRRSPWTVGGIVSHLGAATLLLGIVCLVTFTQKDSSVESIQGQAANVLNNRYQMTYLGQTGDFQADKNNALKFAVVSINGRERFTALLPFALRPVEGGARKIFGHPAIVHHAGGDLYFALKDGPDRYYARGRSPEKTIPLGATQQLGPYKIEFVKFERDQQAAALAMSGQMPDVFPVRAVLRVTFQNQTKIVKPEYVIYSPAYQQVNPVTPPPTEATLPGGWLIAFNGMNAGSADAANPNAGAGGEAGTFTLRPPGPILEGFELEVTTRPMVNLVWLGTLLIFAGGLISMRRRILENREMPIADDVVSVPAPPLSGAGGAISGSPS